MQLSFPAILGLVGLASAASRNCRQYDVAFATCISWAGPPGLSEILDLIQATNKVTDPKTLTTSNSCLGGGGLEYIEDTRLFQNQRDGPSDLVCDDGWIKYETKIKILRWRTKDCPDIDGEMRKAVETRPLTKFWYSNPQGSRVICKE